MRRRSRYGWLELIEGILLILLGIYTLCNPGGMLRGITFAYGFLAVITGISDIVFYAKTERECTTEFAKRAEKAGFVNLDEVLEKGTKLPSREVQH